LVAADGGLAALLAGGFGAGLVAAGGGFAALLAGGLAAFGGGLGAAALSAGVNGLKFGGRFVAV
jgi:hypothetical protein